MEKDDKGSTMIRMGVSGWMFLLVPSYPGCPGSKAVKRSLLLLLLLSFRRTLCSTDIPFCLLHLQNNLLNETWERIVFDRHKLSLYQSSLSIKDWLTKILYGIRPNNYYVVYVSVDLPSVLWCCWLGSRKGFRAVKNWVVGCWHGYLSGARCRLAMAQRIPLPLTVSCFSKI